MSGEMDLDRLMSSMTAVLVEGTYVFVTLRDATWPGDLRPRMVFHEAEGITLVLLKSEAEACGFAYEFPCRIITLNVHSALEAVGFIARIATALADHGMGVNPVAGFYHDHLFVPEGRADQAMQILADLSASVREGKGGGAAPAR